MRCGIQRSPGDKVTVEKRTKIYVTGWGGCYIKQGDVLSSLLYGRAVLSVVTIARHDLSLQSVTVTLCSAGSHFSAGAVIWQGTALRKERPRQLTAAVAVVPSVRCIRTWVAVWVHEPIQTDML